MFYVCIYLTPSALRAPPRGEDIRIIIGCHLPGIRMIDRSNPISYAMETDISKCIRVSSVAIKMYSLGTRMTNTTKSKKVLFINPYLLLLLKHVPDSFYNCRIDNT